MAATTLVGRILLSLIFIVAGLHKITGFSGTVAYMTQHHMPLTSLLAVAAILAEAGGGLCVLLGVRARTAAVVLALFLIPTTLIFHTSLVIVHEQDQSINFMKNLALIGGLLILAAHGPGHLSLDARQRTRSL
jgi:putative oxidoreductase